MLELRDVGGHGPSGSFVDLLNAVQKCSMQVGLVLPT